MPAPRCETCRWWTRMTAVQAARGHCLSNKAHDLGGVYYTREDFGCRFHEPHTPPETPERALGAGGSAA